MTPIALTLTAARPCKMRPRDLHRVPQNAAQHPIGYHVGCPACGFVTSALHGMDGQSIVETEAGVSFSAPVRCLRCDVRMHIAESCCLLEEVRRV